MVDTEIQDLTELAAGNVAGDDVLPIVDVSDTTDDPDGTGKKFSWTSILSDLAAAVQTMTNKTFASFTNSIMADALHLEVRNTSGSEMTKGNVVFISGYNIGQDLPTVDLADANGSATFPVVGLIQETISNNANGRVCVSGRMSGLDTSSFTAGDMIYMSETAGEFSTKPTAAASEVQSIGSVLRSNASQGVVEIIGAFRTNDNPNKSTTDRFRIADVTDPTKLLAWVVSAITTGTQRTITMPDANVDLGTLTDNADTDISANGWVLDEDDLASDDDTKVATQQSIKAFIATQISATILGLTNTNVDTHSTSTVQTLWSVSIPANALGTGNGYEVVIPIQNLDLEQNSARTMTFAIKYGSTEIASFTLTAAGAGDIVNMGGTLTASIFADAATNAQIGFISGSFTGSSSDIAIANASGGAGDGTATEDSTGALTLSVTVLNSASLASHGAVALGGYAKKMIA